MESKNLNIEINFDGKKTLVIAEKGSVGFACFVNNEREFIEYIISYVLDCVDPELKYSVEVKANKG